MPTALASTTPVTPTPIGPSNFRSLVLSLFFIFRIILSLCLFLVDLCSILYFFSGPTFVEVAPSFRFEVVSSSATIPDPASEVIAFFIQFDQFETNDLDLVDF